MSLQPVGQRNWLELVTTKYLRSIGQSTTADGASRGADWPLWRVAVGLPTCDGLIGALEKPMDGGIRARTRSSVQLARLLASAVRSAWRSMPATTVPLRAVSKARRGPLQGSTLEDGCLAEAGREIIGVGEVSLGEPPVERTLSREGPVTCEDLDVSVEVHRGLEPGVCLPPMAREVIGYYRKVGGIQ